jgi:vancomycin resistance protein YoaR
MQTTSPTAPRPGSSFLRKAGWFLAAPLLFIVVITLSLALMVTAYEARHVDRVYTGVTMWGVDLSQMTRDEALAAVARLSPSGSQEDVTLVEPLSGRHWQMQPAQLGVAIDAQRSVEAAMAVGRLGGALEGLQEQFMTWYYGRQLAPTIVVDEAALDEAIVAITAAVERPAVEATLAYDGNTVAYTPSQIGLELDKANLKAQLLTTLGHLQGGEVSLRFRQIAPRVSDTSATAEEIRHIIGSPITFYVQEPMAGEDLVSLQISSATLTEWLRLAVEDTGDGAVSHRVFLDQNAVRSWLRQHEARLYREPANARFYFDDGTRQLVVVAPHVNGRQLDVEATLAQFLAQAGTPNRSVPFVMSEIVPTVHGGATAEELGITELVSDATTWFADSTPERKHNIARAASKFYGIVVAPGETFSFNDYLGEISEEEYETGLIIVGGRTIEGVGGGVCQVSTTLFQAVFWGGFPVEERWAHGYRVGYYEVGEGPGMDATVYSPIVDFKFTNNTPHHLLIENYYNENFESLWFKFYSTSMGRTVEKSGPVIENVRPAKPDVWEFNPELDEGEIEQVDWAAEGADVTVERSVFNRDGELILQDAFVSNYIPWQNIYQYGPGVEPPPPPTPTPEPTPEGTPESTPMP